MAYSSDVLVLTGMRMKFKPHWADEVWNPTTGCEKVSDGCTHCLAEQTVILQQDRLQLPYDWFLPMRIFVNSTGDLFHKDVPDSFITQVFMTIRDSPQHTFVLVTSRADRMRDYLCRWTLADNGWIAAPGHHIGTIPVHRWPLRNLWVGVRIEDQSTAEDRIPYLIQTPAAVRFAYANPLLGQIDLSTLYTHRTSDGDLIRQSLIKYLDWVVAGGEIGEDSRPPHPNWIRLLRDQSYRAGVPFYFEGWGDWLVSSHMIPWIHDDTGIYAWPWKDIGDDTMMIRLGLQVDERFLDGREWNETPKIR